MQNYKYTRMPQSNMRDAKNSNTPEFHEGNPYSGHSNEFVVSNRDGGFTLIETVIYATILAVTFSFVLFTVYEIIDSRYRALSNVEVEEETNFIMRKIAWILSGVERINQPGPSSTSSVLSVDKTNFADNPVILEIVSSRAAISYGGGAPVRLQSTSAVIKKLVFEQVEDGANVGVKVNLEVGFVPRGQLVIYDATSSIETTIYIRK